MKKYNCLALLPSCSHAEFVSESDNKTLKQVQGNINSHSERSEESQKSGIKYCNYQNRYKRKRGIMERLKLINRPAVLKRAGANKACSDIGLKVPSCDELIQLYNTGKTNMGGVSGNFMNSTLNGTLTTVRACYIMRLGLVNNGIGTQATRSTKNPLYCIGD